MLIAKMRYHMGTIVKWVFYKLVYGSKLKIGKKTSCRRHFSIIIASKAKVRIGRDCFFNNDCSIAANQSVTIGDGCLFGENVKIYDHNHRFCDPDRRIKDQGYSNGEIRIGRHCWIGSNVVILKGSEIGDCCVIGAGCVIKGHVPDNTIVTCGQELHMEPIRYPTEDGTAQ